jgi:serine/threonine protein kinase
MSSSTLIKEGSYGCAFTPPLPCKKGRGSRKQRTVGKVMRKKNAAIELSIAALVRAIPNYEDYYVIQEDDLCSDANFRQLRKVYGAKCSILRSVASPQLTQLLAPYGGETLAHIAFDSKFHYVDYLKQLLTAVAKLNAQGICHFDIHGNNITVDFEGHLRIIDFGSAFVGDQITDEQTQKHMYSFQPTYPPQPPELSVQNGLNQSLGMAFSIQSTMDDKKVFPLLQSILGVSKEEQKRSLAEFWATEQLWKGGSWVPWFRAYWRLWDGYAVGVLFLDILRKMLLIPSFIDGEYAKRGPVIRTVLKGLLAANPMKRMTAGEALSVLEGASAAAAPRVAVPTGSAAL